MVGCPVQEDEVNVIGEIDKSAIDEDE